MKLRWPTRGECLAVALWILAEAGLWCWLEPQPRFVVGAGKSACCFGFSPDGKILAALPRNLGDLSYCTGPALLFDADNGRVKAGFGSRGEVFRWLHFCTDGCILVIKQYGNGSLGVFDTQTGEEVARVTGWDACVSPDGRLLAYGTADKAKDFVKLLDVATGQELGTCGAGAPWRFLPGGRVLMVYRYNISQYPSTHYEVKFWDTAEGSHRTSLCLPQFHGWSCAPDGKTVVVRNSEDNADLTRLVDLATGKERLKVAVFRWPVFLDEGRTVAALDNDPTLGLCVKLWDTATGHPTALFPVRVSPAQSLSGKLIASPDGTKLALIVWDQFRAPGSALATRWPALRRWIGSGLSGGTIRVMDARTGRELAAFGHGGRLCCFSPDGRRLALERGGKVEVWDVPPRTPWAEFVILSVVLVLVAWETRREARTLPEVA